MPEAELAHRPSPLSPKRKPLPKGSTFDKQMSSHDDGDFGGKLRKMELTGGSTMVFLGNNIPVLIVDRWEVYVL